MSRDVNEPILDASRDVIEPILDERVNIAVDKVYKTKYGGCTLMVNII